MNTASKEAKEIFLLRGCHTQNYLNRTSVVYNLIGAWVLYCTKRSYIVGRCVVKGCAQDGPHPVLPSPLRRKNKTSRIPERCLTVSTHLDSLRPYSLFYGVPALYQST